MPRVYADFHLDDFNRVRLTCAGTLEDLARRGIELCDGLELMLYMDNATTSARRWTTGATGKAFTPPGR
jgi:hypothetical protein